MTPYRALLRWGALPAAGGIAALLPWPAEPAFAVAAIVVLGVPHGAADLALVEPPRRPAFLLAYLGCLVAVLVAWVRWPEVVLPGFLVLSAWHFADEATPRSPLPEPALGGFLVGGPVVLHPAGVAGMFAQVTGPGPLSAHLALALVVVGAVSAIGLVVRLPGRPDAIGRATAIAATLLLPPLAGFATGFVLLHACEQTGARRRALGHASLAAYLRGTAWPIAGAAAVLPVIAVALAVGGRPGGVTLLFAGIAALATPHMLVTPLFVRGYRKVRRPSHASRLAARVIAA